MTLSDERPSAMLHDSAVSDSERRAAAMRPAGPNSGTQVWKNLLFVHWEIPVDAIRSLVPEELEIDTFEGRAFVGLVPFQMRQIRPTWLPRALAFNFFETNVRTYVHHRGRPGVYFFSLDANSRLAVWAARLGWSLPYFYSRMHGTESGNRFTYGCNRQGVKSFVDFEAPNVYQTATMGTLEYFLLERYLLFVKKRGSIYVGQVHHRPYTFSTAKLLQIEDHLVPAAGFKIQDRTPGLIHFSPGVDVEVFAIRPTFQTA